jgi:hypothetical protein
MPAPSREAVAAPDRPGGLFRGYAPLDGTFDEAIAPDGTVRSQLARVIALLDEVPRAEFRKRKKLADGREWSVSSPSTWFRGS